MTNPVTRVSPAPPDTQTTPALPNWLDSQAVATYLTSLAATAAGVVAAVHPGFTEPAIVQALIPSIAVIVAGAAQAVNVVTHRSAHTKLAVAQAGNLVVHAPPPPQAVSQMGPGPSPAEIAGSALVAAQKAVAAAEQAMAATGATTTT